MKQSTKRILMILCTVVLAVGSLVGTIAYLTDKDAATNTFTVGKVEITLDEADVTADGTPIAGAERVTENEYHLIPGSTYTKDPTIHVSDDSEGCYLFVKVENGIAAIEGGKTIADQMKELNWEAVEGADNVYVLTKSDKHHIVYKGTEVVVFNTFTIAGDSVNGTKLDEYKDAEIVVTAYAVQAAGFENSTSAEIWKSAFGNT